MASREGEERGQSSLSAPSAETAESDGNVQQQRLETPPITMMQPPGANSPANNIQQQHYPGGDQTALFNMLRAQVEYYFSPQNLARDSYLRNMLTDAPTKQHHQPPPPQNVQLMTPIEVIANFPKVWNICASFGAAGMMPEPPAVLLNKALQGSTIVTISSEGAWIGPTSQQLPPFTGGSAPPSPSPSHHGPPATIAAAAAPPPPQFQQSPYNMSPYPPPQMMMIPMQQPDGTILHQSFPPPYYMGGPPPPLNSNNNNRPLSVESISPSSASLEDAGSIPSQMKESSKISDASLSSLSEQQQQQQPTMQAQQQQQQQPPPPQYGGPMMGQQQQQYPMPPQQFLSPPYGVPMHPYPPYYNPQQQQQQQMPPPNFMPPPGVRYGGPPPPPPRGYHPANGPPPPYPYPGMMPPPPPPQFVGDGYPPPHPHGYPPRHQPNVGDTHRKVGGGGGGSFDGKERGHKKKKKNNNFDRKRGNESNYGYRSPNNFGQQQQQNYGGGGGGASSSSPHYNNRYPKQYAKKGGDANNNEQQNKKVGEKEVVLNPFDFPGLDGKAASDLSAKSAAATDEKLVGYASALLKKNEKGNGTLQATATSAADPSAATSPENEEDNTMAQQTEAMEKEILSEFHDLSIRESDTAEQQQNINDNKQYETPAAVDKTDGHTVETSPSSTENGVVSPQSATNEISPTILPDPATKPPTEQNPRVDLEEGVGSAPPPAAVAVEQQKLGDDNQVNDNKEQNTEVEKPKAPAAWGSKRLFADVVAAQK